MDEDENENGHVDINEHVWYCRPTHATSVAMATPLLASSQIYICHRCSSLVYVWLWLLAMIVQHIPHIDRFRPHLASFLFS